MAATLLGYVASSGDPVTGGALLLTYTSGYVAPLLAAATVTGSLQRIMSARAYTAWVTPASGEAFETVMPAWHSRFYSLGFFFFFNTVSFHFAFLHPTTASFRVLLL